MSFRLLEAARGFEVVGFLEADPDAPTRRANAGIAAGREVQSSANSLDGAAVRLLLARLAQLKRELQGVIASNSSTEFRRYTAQTLINEVDRLIADATRDVQNASKGLYTQANGLGLAAAEEPIKAARIALSPAPRVDAELVTAAFDLTGDLLTVPMQQFRNQVVQGIRRAATAGDSNGYVQLAQNIGAAGFDAASFKAERIVRTELSRVLNEATFARLQALAKDMPFLRKGWRAAKDSRVRTGHREAAGTYARGSGIPIAEPFQVNVYQELPNKSPKLIGTALLRFPVDPNTTPAGRIAAGATIMCRCNAFVDFNLEELRKWSTSRSQGVKVDDTPPPPGLPVPPAPVVPKAPRKPKAQRTAVQARERLAAIDKGNATKRTELEAKRAAQESEFQRLRRAAEKLELAGGPDYVQALERLDVARAENARLGAEYRAFLASSAKAMRAALAVPIDQRVSIPFKFGKGANTFGNGYSQSYQNGRPLKRVYTGTDEVKKKYRDAVREVEKLVGNGSFSFARGGGFGTKGSPGYSPGRVLIDRARNLDNPKLEGERAYANAYRSANGEANSINMGSSDDARVVAHELGHLLEFNTPEVHAAALKFLASRTAGEQLRKLSAITGDTGYKDHEVARPDKFLSPYMGKDYGSQATEIVSMGLEYFYADPLKLAKLDPDYFDFIYDLLRGKFRP